MESLGYLDNRSCAMSSAHSIPAKKRQKDSNLHVVLCDSRFPVVSDYWCQPITFVLCCRNHVLN